MKKLNLEEIQLNIAESQSNLERLSKQYFQKLILEQTTAKAIEILNEENIDIVENQRFINRNTPENLTNINYGSNKPNNDISEVSLELKNQIGQLNQLKQLFNDRFSSLSPEINFFLDDSNDISVNVNNHTIYIEQIKYSTTEQKAREMLMKHQGPFNGTSLRDTWSKGRDFYFINKGDYIKVININENNKYALCEFDNKTGYLHVNEIRVYGHILTNNQVKLT